MSQCPNCNSLQKSFLSTYPYPYVNKGQHIFKFICYSCKTEFFMENLYKNNKLVQSQVYKGGMYRYNPIKKELL